MKHPSDEGLGRSRGGLTTTVHLACDGKGRPISVVITPGQRHDCTQLAPVLDAIRVSRLGDAGARAPVLIGTSPTRGIAIRAAVGRCASGRSRTPFLSVVISARRTTWPGRPLAFDQATYARRNVVERCTNRL